jgi:DNA-binding transcriptional ArsR family regulator
MPPSRSDDAGSSPFMPLPDTVPVEMPDLPEILDITTPEQMKALGDPIRTQITVLIKHQPATAKQIARKMGLTPGAVGHHLHVLERAGLVQVVALRRARGTIAKYYTRTASMYGFGPEVLDASGEEVVVTMITNARAELLRLVAAHEGRLDAATWFPHARIAEAKVNEYVERIDALIRDFMNEPAAPDGKVYGLFSMIMLAPPDLQIDETDVPDPADGEDT